MFVGIALHLWDREQQCLFMVYHTCSIYGDMLVWFDPQFVPFLSLYQLAKAACACVV